MSVLKRLLAWFKARLAETDDDSLEPVEAEFVPVEDDPPVAEPTAVAVEKETPIDQFFTKMPPVVEKTDVDIKDILAAPPPPAPPAEKEKAVAEAGKGDGGLMSSLFEADEAEENAATAGLIASLADVTIEEILNDIQDLRVLMFEAVGGQKGAHNQEPVPVETGVSSPVSQAVGQGG